MTIIALTSVKGSPGVTSLATALAATWPGYDDSPVLLIEADPAGGVLGPRHGLTAEPSLASYMADARRGFDPAIAAANSQEIAPRVRALIGPVDPAIAERSLSWGGTALADGLRARPHLPVVADVGRLDAVSPAMPLAQAADETLLIMKPSLEHAAIAVHRARAFADLGCRVSVVCVGTGPDDPGDVAHALGIGLAAVIPDVVNADDILRSCYDGNRRSRRTLLWRSITSLSENLMARLERGGSALPATDQVEGVASGVAHTSEVALGSGVPQARHGAPDAVASLPETVPAITVPSTMPAATASEDAKVSPPPPPPPMAQTVAPHPPPPPPVSVPEPPAPDEADSAESHLSVHEESADQR